MSYSVALNLFHIKDMADEQENIAIEREQEESIKVKFSKLECPFTWEILDTMMKHSINGKNDEDDAMMDDETFYPLERLLISCFKCYKAVSSADKNEAIIKIEKAGEILIKIQEE